MTLRLDLDDAADEGRQLAEEDAVVGRRQLDTGAAGADEVELTLSPECRRMDDRVGVDANGVREERLPLPTVELPLNDDEECRPLL